MWNESTEEPISIVNMQAVFATNKNLYRLPTKYRSVQAKTSVDERRKIQQLTPTSYTSNDSDSKISNDTIFLFFDIYPNFVLKVEIILNQYADQKFSSSSNIWH